MVNHAAGTHAIQIKVLLAHRALALAVSVPITMAVITVIA